MSGTDPTLLGFGELRRALDGRTLLARDLAGATLERIERLDGKLRAYVELDAAGALARAAAADDELDAGTRLGPLHRIPIGIKEGIGVEGLRFEGGGYNVPGLKAPADATVSA